MRSGFALPPRRAQAIECFKLSAVIRLELAEPALQLLDDLARAGEGRGQSAFHARQRLTDFGFGEHRVVLLRKGLELGIEPRKLPMLELESGEEAAECVDLPLAQLERRYLAFDRFKEAF